MALASIATVLLVASFVVAGILSSSPLLIVAAVPFVLGLFAFSLSVTMALYVNLKRQFVVLRARSERSLNLLASEASAREGVLLQRISQLSEDLNESNQNLQTYRHEIVGKLLVISQSNAKSAGLFSDTDLEIVANQYALTDPIASYWVLNRHNALGLATPNSLWSMASALRELGYWERSLDVLGLIVDKTNSQKDIDTYRFRKGELDVFRGAYKHQATVKHSEDYEGIEGHVLHVVGKALPKTQSGYTLRTHYLALAQRDSGVYVSVVSQMGEDEGIDGSEVQFVDSVPYYALQGPKRTSLPLNEWLEHNIEALASLVRRIRPSILHAHSDFLNGFAAEAVGHEFGIPVVYESRGFWEESWISRTLTRFPDVPWSVLFDSWGRPDAYVLRASMEASVRDKAAHVITLARVMKDHIVAQGLDASHISISPNAVNAEEFPVVSRSEAQSRKMQIGADELVLGYISSIVEYEGIDVLLRAFDQVSNSFDGSVRLLIVGDGPVLNDLQVLRGQLGTRGVIFTGRIAHEEILEYYSVIDIFVIPRKPATVCHLVTPLKPFEAFSTGRAVVMSDVVALKEIASDSGAAETFEAGNVNSLTDVLLELISDPPKRSYLAEKGAEWVRKERTWSRNAETNVEVYKALGFSIASGAGMSHEESLAFDYEAMVRWVRGQEISNFSRWFYGQTKHSSTDIIDRGWRTKGFSPVKFDLPVSWDEVCSSERSWAYNLHTWEFMDPFIREYSVDGEVWKLSWCVARALDWIHKFVENDDASPSSMAWYDMALGLRSPRLMSLIALAVKERFSSVDIKRLIGGAMRHRYVHSLERSFNSRTNHGYYSAMGQTVLGNGLRPLPGMALLEMQGHDRLARMVAGQFLTDGVHSEHSPDYHRMLLNSFELAVRQGFIEDKTVVRQLSKAAYALGWMIKPDGRLAQFGDSPGRVIATGKVGDTGDSHTNFLVSKGSAGVPCTQTLEVFPASGYAFVRYPQPVGEDDHESASYLALTAAFHSRTHKHADDLNFIWSDRGHEILVDAGRYGYGSQLEPDSPKRKEGYYYASEERQFIESTIAHNTVAADGENHERRYREPYGSGLTDCFENEGLFELNGQVDHKYWRHTRSLTLRPSEWLLVQDEVLSLDDDGHDFRSWFNLSGDLEVVQDEYAIRVDHESWRVPLWITGWGDDLEPILPVKGGQNPMRGWRSIQDRSLVPTWSLGFALNQVGGGLITTLFNFGREPFADLPLDADY